MPIRISGQDIDSFIKVWDAIRIEYGIDALKGKLKEISLPDTDKKRILIKNKILSEISDLYSVSSKLILTSNKTNVISAKIMATLLFNEHLELTQGEISSMFGEHRTAVNKRIRQFMRIQNQEEISPTSEYGKIFDKEFIDNYQTINKCIKDYIKKL